MDIKQKNKRPLRIKMISMGNAEVGVAVKVVDIKVNPLRLPL